MVNAWAIILALACSNLARRRAAARHKCNSNELRQPKMMDGASRNCVTSGWRCQPEGQTSRERIRTRKYPRSRERRFTSSALARLEPDGHQRRDRLIHSIFRSTSISLDHEAIEWNRIMISSPCLNVV